MRFPDSFLEQVSRATDLVAVIGTHVALKPGGQSYKGLCPFHDEHTPSFTVNPVRRRFYCFGCGAGGTVFQFLMQQEGLTFADAVKKLALAANLPLPDLLTDEGADDLPVYQALQLAADLFHTCLLLDPQAQPARDYLLSRGLQPEDWETFKLGYAPAVPGFLQQARRPPTIKLSHFEAAGLIMRYHTRIHDVFQARIMFPIADLQGRISGFSGRVLPDAPADHKGRKYVNTTETGTFRKSSLLYLYDRAVATRGREKTLLIVEGYLDAIALHKAGWTNTVAMMGTALSPSHVETFQKANWRPMLCFDADKAGAQATWKALGTLLGTGVKPSVCTLPVPGDPDDFLRTHRATAFHAAVTQAKPLFDWACDQIAAARQQHRADDYATLLTQLQKVLTQLPDPLYREGLFEMLYRRFAPTTPRPQLVATDDPPLVLTVGERRLVHALTLHWLTPAQLHRLQPAWCPHPTVARYVQICKAQPSPDFPLVLDGQDSTLLHPLIRAVRLAPDPPPAHPQAMDQLLTQLEHDYSRRQLQHALTQGPLPLTPTTRHLLTGLQAPQARPLL